MKMTMHPDMIEATRLTREGRLIEATAVLQRMLQSGIEPDTKTEGGLIPLPILGHLVPPTSSR